MLLNVCGGPNLSLHEINDAANVIYDESNKDAHIIVGSVIDHDMGDEIVVSVVATGFSAGATVQSEKVVASVVQPKVEEKKLYAEPQLAKIMIDTPDMPAVDSLEVPAYLRKQEFSDQPVE